jgi:predicted acetyltransferase
MNMRVDEASLAEKSIIRRLMQLYLHDLSEFDDRDVDSFGEYSYKYLDHYWTEPARQAFLMRADGKIAGFALVRTGRPNSMAEFFIIRRYRRQGIGRAAAAEIISRFAGEWEITQLVRNRAASGFWRSVIAYPYREDTSGEETRQRFTVPDGRPAPAGH